MFSLDNTPTQYTFENQKRKILHTSVHLMSLKYQRLHLNSWFYNKLFHILRNRCWISPACRVVVLFLCSMVWCWCGCLLCWYWCICLPSLFKLSVNLSESYFIVDILKCKLIIICFSLYFPCHVLCKVNGDTLYGHGIFIFLQYWSKYSFLLLMK